MAPVETPITSPDTKQHYGVIIIGAGMSGIGASIQLQRKLGYTDVMIFEKSNEIGGTWSANTYPGAGSDVPISLYSYSWHPATDVKSQWAGQEEVMRYMNLIKKTYGVHNVCFETIVTSAAWSDENGIWTLEIKNVRTGATSHRTCNVLVSAVGALSEPNIPEFPGRENFKGAVFHSARWDHSVDLKGKNVVIVGNGCSASQIVPEIVKDCGTLTQVARSRQSVLRRMPVPDSPRWNWLLNCIPGLIYFQRYLVYWALESFFVISDIKKGEKLRASVLDDTKTYIREVAPEKYWDVLTPDFDIAAKRRIFDSGFYKALNEPNMELVIGDSVTQLTPTGVITKSGRSIPADVIVLCTGFKVQDFMFPLKIVNGKGVSLLDRFKQTNAKAFRATCVSEYPNLFTLMGVNSATGHSSVIFTTECQITMMLKLVAPVLGKLAKSPSIVPAPSVVVTKKAEDEYFESLRAEMKNKVWEKNGGVSWYVDQASGLCTALYPWSQTSFWWNSAFPNIGRDFRRIGC